MKKVDLAIIQATPGEIAPVRELLTGPDSFEIAGNPFSIYACRDLKLLVGTTGIGKVNAAAVTAALLSRFEAGEVWNVGCAGAYSGSELEAGDVLISDNCICADEGVLYEEGPLPASSLGIPLVVKKGRPFYDFFPLDEHLSRRKIRSLLPAGKYTKNLSGGVEPASSSNFAQKRGSFKIFYGASLTVGMTSGDMQTADARFRRFGALAENMESSAVAQTCLLFDVPFLEFRGISNFAGVRKKAKWDFGGAAEHCLAVIVHILKTGPGSS
jgi:futalosine hydrolase